MTRVLEECDRAGTKLAADPVHDLRVALRRCRSMADGIMAFDPDPSWKQMKKAGKKLFRSLGELRDVQVMQEWVNKLGSPDDLVTGNLLQFLDSRETQHKIEAAQALQEFDRKQWKKWSTSLPRRAARVRNGSLVFKHLALERWTEAYRLHQRALRSGSQLAWHSLRIGLKRFRYIVENFLPAQHEAWINDMKELQDLLGEVHDFDVLWNTALQIKAFPDPPSRRHWHGKILEERSRRIGHYREKMVGKNSLWLVWRSPLPTGKQVEVAALKRLTLWAAVLDPDFRHSRHVMRLALQLYDGMVTDGDKTPEQKKQREILQIAALLHDVGLSKRQKGHHKATYRMIEKLVPPLGVSEEKLRIAAVVSRYHRGALPRTGQATLAHISPSERRLAKKLAGILRLANAFDADHHAQIQRLHATAKNGYFVIAAQGYNPGDRMAENIAAGRHLLEMACRRPIVVKRLILKTGKSRAAS
jgi:CHAD domain-containing protein